MLRLSIHATLSDERWGRTQLLITANATAGY